MMGACYLLEFPNGKVYVGITTKTVGERFAEHCVSIRRTRYRHYPLYRAMRKYGPESMTIHTLAESEDWPTLCEYERTFIALFGSQHRTLGYNMTSGGDGVSDPSDEAREKVSIAVAVASRTRWADPEYREKMTTARRQRKARALVALAENVPDYGEYAGMGIAEPVDLVDRVRVAVQCSSLGSKQLAWASGVSQMAIHYFTTRQRHPSDATLHRLAEALGVAE